ncbi:MAG: mechanosensitive ion channel domain-containing protein, partial [Pseudomonadota bacterium]
MNKRTLRRHAAAAIAAVGLAVFFTAGDVRAQSSEPTAFPIDALNEGLGSPPPRLDRSTPRATLEAFLSATARGDNARAAHLLDLDAVPAAQQSAQGPELAGKLSAIIDRKVPIDFGAIPDRPDGMITVGSDRQPMVGEPRKSMQLGVLELERWPVTIRLNRVQVADEAPVWVFSRQSVEHIDALYARHGPTALEAALPGPLRAKAFWGLEWWEVLALPIVFSFAAALGVMLYRFITALKRAMPLESVQAAVARARLPVVLCVAGLFLHAVISYVFVFSAGVDATISVLFWVLIVFAVAIGAARVLDTIIDYTSDRYLDTIDKPENTSDRDWYTNLSAAKRIGVLLVVVVGVAAAISALNIFSSFGMSLVVSAGIATAVFGLAAQAVLGNIFASLQLALAKPIRIGDAIYYKDHWAYVERINYTYVQLRTWDQKRFIVPVKEFVSTAFENWTKAEPRMIKPVLLTLDHASDVEALRELFRTIVQDDPDWSEGAEPKVQVIDHGDDGMKVRFYCTADDPTAAWDLHCRVREKLLAELREGEADQALPRTRIALVGGVALDGDVHGAE